MGIGERSGDRFYIDANIFIYAVEGFPQFAERAGRFLSAIDEGAVTAFTSQLTLAEVLVEPLRSGKLEAAALYREMIQDAPHLTIAQVDRDVLLARAELRAELGGKLPDAIHAATAVAARCAFFLTEDKSVRLPPGLTRLSLLELQEGQ